MKNILCLFVLSLLFFSCKKNTSSSNPTYNYSVRLTDAPGPYNAVYIDLKAVEVTGNNGAVIPLNVNAGIYNLLDFTNGVDTLIATGSLNVSQIEQIRLILGPNNSVVVNNISYPLSTPSAEQSGLKLQVHQTLQAGVNYMVLLDFDANKSIVETGNGTYKLKPVIRTVETAISGSIKGRITPIGTLAYVTAVSGESYTAYVHPTGEFIIQGLPPGNYTLTITPAAPFNPIAINNVVVSVGVTTDIGIIAL